MTCHGRFPGNDNITEVVCGQYKDVVNCYVMVITTSMVVDIMHASRGLFNDAVKGKTFSVLQKCDNSALFMTERSSPGFRMIFMK